MMAPITTANWSSAGEQLPNSYSLVLISILLPVFNAADTVADAVTSILTQTCTDWELIIVDDGSTDGTQDVLSALAQNDQRIRLHRFQTNRGIVAALNHAFAHSSGDLIARMDADDISHPDRLQKQKAYLDQHPATGLVAAAVSHLGNAHTQQGYATHIIWMNTLLAHEDIFKSRFIESPFAHPSVMFRRSVWEQHGGYRSGDFPEDYELWLRWLQEGVHMARIPEVLLQWRDLPSRLSRNHPMYSADAFYAVRTRYLAAWLLSPSGLAGRKLWIWGAGRLTRRRAGLLHEHSIAITGYIDVDLRKIGRTINGLPVISHLDLPSPLKTVGEPRRTTVVGQTVGELRRTTVEGPGGIQNPSQKGIFILSYVSSRGVREEINAFLQTKGYHEGKDFLFVG